MDIVFVCLCSCICTYVCGYIWRPEVGLGYLLQFVSTVPPCFFRHWLSLSLKLAAWLHWPPNSWDLPVSTSCSTEITSDPSFCLGVGYTKSTHPALHQLSHVPNPVFIVVGALLVCLFVCLFYVQVLFVFSAIASTRDRGPRLS